MLRPQRRILHVVSRSSYRISRVECFVYASRPRNIGAELAEALVDALVSPVDLSAPSISETPSATSAARMSTMPERRSRTVRFVDSSGVGPSITAKWQSPLPINRHGVVRRAFGGYLYFCAHLIEVVRVGETILVDRLMDRRDAFRLGEEHGERLLPVGHVSRMNVGADLKRRKLAFGTAERRAPERDAVLRHFVFSAEPPHGV